MKKCSMKCKGIVTPPIESVCHVLALEAVGGPLTGGLILGPFILSLTQMAMMVAAASGVATVLGGRPLGGLTVGLSVVTAEDAAVGVPGSPLGIGPALPRILIPRAAVQAVLAHQGVKGMDATASRNAGRMLAYKRLLPALPRSLLQLLHLLCLPPERFPLPSIGRWLCFRAL